MRKLFLKLRRCEVFGTLGLYVGVSWMAIEASGVFLPACDAPDWAMRAIIVVALIGLPIAIFLAWVYDVAEDEIQVQSAPTDTTITPTPIGGRKMDFVVIGLLSVALSFSGIGIIRPIS
jgi:hypothetical protein